MDFNQSSMRKGKLGLFGEIEQSSNLRNSKAFLALSAILLVSATLIYFLVKEISSGFLFLIFSSVIFVLSLIEFFVVRKRKGLGKAIKWVLACSYLLAAVVSISLLGPTVSLVLIIPILTSIPYCSFIFTFAVSAFTLLGTFAPILLSSYLNFFDLNVIELYDGSIIKILGTLESSINTGAIDITATKVNEIIAIYLPIVALVILIAFISCFVTKSLRERLLQQYSAYRNSRE